MANAKVKNATSHEYGGVAFKSRLEASAYRKLEDWMDECCYKFEYEAEKVVLWEGLKLADVQVYVPKKISVGKYSKDLSQLTRSLRKITYTPDFKITKGNYVIYMDVKGNENDVYPYKKKMFLKVLEERKDGKQYIFMEPHSVKQVMDCIEIIRNL